MLLQGSCKAETAGGDDGIGDEQALAYFASGIGGGSRPIRAIVIVLRIEVSIGDYVVVVVVNAEIVPFSVTALLSFVRCPSQMRTSDDEREQMMINDCQVRLRVGDLPAFSSAIFATFALPPP